MYRSRSGSIQDRTRSAVVFSGRLNKRYNGRMNGALIAFTRLRKLLIRAIGLPFRVSLTVEEQTEIINAHNDC